MAIVDCHMHYWRYPGHYVNFTKVYGEEISALPHEALVKRYDCPIEAYLEQMEGSVDKAILMGMNYECMGIINPHEELSNLSKRYRGKLYWCCNIHPYKKGAVDEFERCVTELGAVGMGEWGPAYMGFNEDDERCFPIYEKAIELDVPMVIHTGPTRTRLSHLKYVNMFNIDEVAIRYPELRIVICHMGYYKYEDAIFLMQKHENIFGDISWLGSLSGLDDTDRSVVHRKPPVVPYPYYQLLHPLLYYLSGAFGLRDKIIFGSDFPGGSPKQDVKLLNNINELTAKYNLPEIPKQPIDNILHENWKKVFKL